MKDQLHSIRRNLVAATVFLGSAAALAAGELNLSHPNWNTGLGAASWMWQSITVSQESTLHTFGLLWNGSTGNLAATADVNLLAGEGLEGTVVASTTARISYDPGSHYNYLAADFGSLDLALGQYTLSYYNLSDIVWLLGTAGDSYSGGKFVSDWYGSGGSDAAFISPVPNYIAVPEPSALALAAVGGAGLLCFRRRQ